MLFKSLFVYSIMTVGLLVHGATEPESTCFNPRLRSYSSVGEFVKEATSKFDKNDFTGQGDAKAAAQAFVCASAMFKWMKTFGTSYYDLDAYNWTDKTIRIFGQDVEPKKGARGKVYNDKGYFFWRDTGVCYMTKFKNNSSIFFAENIQIKSGKQLWGGPRRDSYQLRDCNVVQVDNSLCDNATISYEEEAYVMGKWLKNMQACKTTY